MKALKTLVVAMALAAGNGGFIAHAATGVATAKAAVQIQQIRNATAKIDYAGKTFLVDPFLAKKGAYPGFPDTFHSELRNPTVELPMPVKDIMSGVDAVIVTHTHLDHWDGGDHKFIPKAMPLFVQHEADAKVIRGQGYTNVRIMTDNTEFEGVRLTKTGGRHGTEEMYSKRPLGDALGEAMGVVFQAPVPRPSISWVTQYGTQQSMARWPSSSPTWSFSTQATLA
jgi:L-ascorbate metabolism protein UlaG (beta-lactamase superfamily)